MTEQALRKMIAAGESTRQEFKSWVKCKDYRQRKELAVESAVVLANTKGGVLLFGRWKIPLQFTSFWSVGSNGSRRGCIHFCFASRINN